MLWLSPKYNTGQQERTFTLSVTWVQTDQKKILELWAKKCIRVGDSPLLSVTHWGITNNDF